MKFIIEKSSDLEINPYAPPVDGAVLEEIVSFISRQGIQYTEKVWVADVDDILEFAKKVRFPVIVKPKYKDETYNTLEIYDGFRE